MKAAAKTQKPKRQEEHANFISWRFALLCGCILLALAFLLGRVAWLQVISPDMLVKEGDTVAVGDALGTVGELPAESAMETHVHLEFLEDGAYVDPAKYFAPVE